METCRNQFDLFKQHDAFGPKEYEALAAHCTRVDIDFISTPFDNDAVEFLAPLVPCFKIASADITNLPLLRRVALHAKPVLLSTGAADFTEIDWAVQVLRESGAPSIVLLHCVLNYPTQYQDAHLATICGLAERYPSCLIGYSDHTLPDPQMIPLTTAFLLGACVIEKHFTHDRLLPGNDHYHSMDVSDLKRFVARIASVQTLLGETSEKTWLPTEEAARRNARRSLVLANDLAAGTLLDDNCVVCKRPAFGISPVYYDQVIGRRTRRDLPRDHILQWTDLEGSVPPDFASHLA
jgi:N-acetylneuraminate synthase